MLYAPGTAGLEFVSCQKVVGIERTLSLFSGLAHCDSGLTMYMAGLDLAGKSCRFCCRFVNQRSLFDDTYIHEVRLLPVDRAVINVRQPAVC